MPTNVDIQLIITAIIRKPAASAQPANRLPKIPAVVLSVGENVQRTSIAKV